MSAAGRRRVYMSALVRKPPAQERGQICAPPPDARSQPTVSCQDRLRKPIAGVTGLKLASLLSAEVALRERSTSESDGKCLMRSDDRWRTRVSHWARGRTRRVVQHTSRVWWVQYSAQESRVHTLFDTHFAMVRTASHAAGSCIKKRNERSRHSETCVLLT